MECLQVGDVEIYSNSNRKSFTCLHDDEFHNLSFEEINSHLNHFSVEGLVTTTQVTHASPAGVYAHTANRNWESNQILLDDGADPEVCTDIAKQLVNGQVGKKLKVSKMKQHNDNREHEKEDKGKKKSLLEKNKFSFLFSLLSVNETFCNKFFFIPEFCRAL